MAGKKGVAKRVRKTLSEDRKKAGVKAILRGTPHPEIRVCPMEIRQLPMCCEHVPGNNTGNHIPSLFKNGANTAPPTRAICVI